MQTCPRRLHVGRTVVHQLISSGKLESVKWAGCAASRPNASPVRRHGAPQPKLGSRRWQRRLRKEPRLTDILLGVAVAHGLFSYPVLDRRMGMRPNHLSGQLKRV